MPKNLTNIAADGLQNARPRAQQIEDYWQQYPGAAPGGTGLTGLMPDDAQGWSNLLNMQTEHQNLLNQSQGKPPVTVRQGKPLGGMPPDLADDPIRQAQLQRMIPTLNSGAIANTGPGSGPLQGLKSYGG